MSRKRVSTVLMIGAVLCGVSMPAVAQTGASPEVAGLQAEIDALKTEVSQMRQASSDTWLDERRAEEVKGLIREVLADAETRASLLQDGAVAGHNGEHFFLGSADGNNSLEVNGQIQIRGIWDLQDNRGDEDDAGIQIRRAKLGFSGNVITPKLQYLIGLSVGNLGLGGDLGVVVVEDVIVGYQLADGLTIKAGKFKLPFLRDELTSSGRQQAVERASVTEFFTVDRSEQIQLAYSTDNYQLVGSLNDGANEDFSTAGSDPVEIGLTGRADVRVAGDWAQKTDYTAWSGEDFAAFLGAAIHYQAGDSRNADNGSESQADYVGWTIDGSVENNGLNLYGALMGGHTEYDTTALATQDRDMYGYLVQAGYNLDDTLEPFIRWEQIDQDVAGQEEPGIITFGVNYFLSGHNAKWTTDVVWVYDGDVPTANEFGGNGFGTGMGISNFASATNDELVVVRTQFQLLF